MLRSLSTPSLYTTLRADAMYFHAAKMSYTAAKEAHKNIGQAKKAFALLRHEEDAILDKYNGDSWSAYNELEPLYIQMEGAEYNIGAAYGPYLQNIAITHILCTTATEAHINMIAKEKLRGKYRDHFEKISIEGKWLFLPRILGRSSFEQGAEPFQSFSVMIKYRNELVHYKERREKWEWISKGKPKFLDKLGLSLPKAQRSLKTVKDMILALSEMIDRERPHWLREGYDDLPSDIVTNFFDVKIERST